MPQLISSEQYEFLKTIGKILYNFDTFNATPGGIQLIEYRPCDTEEIIATFPDWHTLVDHLRRELATWHATTQRELWQIIEPEVRNQIAEIVGIESDGY